ncbi:MAG: pyridoxal phosphate-dependent aminotransferase [Planctomycetes bacterium]|nr:pyridoxal phosphate-dependent aminotransferase [Planctomycetota bacterium]
MRLNARVDAIALSTTLALDARAKALAAAGRDVINMSVGEPDANAPEAVQVAAERAVRGGKVRYTPAEGTQSLRKAIAAHISATRGVEFTPAEIAVCHSAKHALSGALMALIETGDEVVMLLPAWVSYVEIVKYAGGVPVEVAPRPDLGPDLAAIERKITKKTRGLLINSPCNPSGYVLSESEVRALSALAEKHDLWIVTDEIYRRLVYEGAPNYSPVSISPAVRARTVIVDGASKAFAMTGYRIGYVAAPKDLAAAVGRLNSQLTGCPNAISQAAFEAALTTEPPEVGAMCAEFGKRRDFLIAGLKQLGLETPIPRGAFYAFPNVRPYLDARGSSGFCEDLLEQQNLAVVPGSAFGSDDYVRLSYAIAIEEIGRALDRLGAFLRTHAERPAPSGARKA